MWAMLIQGVSYGYAAGITPGPLQALMLSETLQRGWRHAIWLILAPLISDGPVVFIVLLILRDANATLLRIISLIGALFVLYIAYGLWGQIQRGDFEAMLSTASEEPAETTSTIAAVRKAILVNALGPGPWLFWSTAMGPIAISAWRDAPITAVVFVVAFYIIFMVVMAGLILLFHQARRLGPQVVRVALWIGLLAMIFFALNLFVKAAIGLDASILSLLTFAA